MQFLIKSCILELLPAAMNKRIAIIDIGTNTFNLLIVDRSNSDFEIVYKERIGVGLGHNGINHSKIAPDAFERGISTLKKYHQKCIDLNVGEISAIGTSAIRNALNKNEFAKAALNQAKININIISGSDEANYIYHGVELGHLFETPTLIMDIGGGSTEFIFADKTGILSKASYEIGVSRIYQLFDLPSKLDIKTVELIEAYLETETDVYFNPDKASTLVGSSGSFKTFYELLFNQRYPRNEYIQIELDDLLKTLNHTIFSTRAEREVNDFIIPIRKEMINIAAVKTRWIIKKLNIQTFTVSPFSLKEGLIFSEHEKFNYY